MEALRLEKLPLAHPQSERPSASVLEPQCQSYCRAEIRAGGAPDRGFASGLAPDNRESALELSPTDSVGESPQHVPLSSTA